MTANDAGLRLELDHLVVAANNLDEGRAWCQAVLGLEASAGGRHDGLATHNVLVNLATTDRKRYLEIIAIDPDAGASNFPRWFGLDTTEVQSHIAHGPRLVAWVARCAGSDDAIERLAQTPGYAAQIVRQASRANFRWRFSFTPDGQRINGGVLPHLIQREGAAHPCDRLPDSGVVLSSLTLGSPAPERILALLDALAWADADVHVGQSTSAQLVAVLGTPRGPVVLD